MTEIEGIGKEVDDSLKLEENSDRGTCWKRRKEVEKGEQRRLKPGKKAIMTELTARLEKSGAMKFDVEGENIKRNAWTSLIETRVREAMRVCCPSSSRLQDCQTARQAGRKQPSKHLQASTSMC